MTNSDIIKLYETLIELRDSEYDFNVKIGFNLIRNMTSIEPIYNDIMAARDIIVKQYIKEDGMISNEDISKVNQKILELLKIECDPEIYKIKLEDIEGYNFKMKIIEGLYPIIQ